MSTEEHGCWIYLTKKGNQRTHLNILDPPQQPQCCRVTGGNEKNRWLQAGFYVILLRRTELGPSEPGASIPDQPHMILIQQLISHESTTHKEGSVVTSLNLRRRVMICLISWQSGVRIQQQQLQLFPTKLTVRFITAPVRTVRIRLYCRCSHLQVPGRDRLLWDSAGAECDGDICIVE